MQAAEQKPIRPGSRGWVTQAIIALNVGIFLAMAVTARQFVSFDLPVLLAWGANLGPLTTSGQWWRLLTAVFLHVGVLHVTFNMWALWYFGRQVEKLFGSRAYLFLYLASGLLASMGSTAWNPLRTSVGASGAIFGVLGAFIAFQCVNRASLPASSGRSNWFNASLFVLFNLLNGALQPGVDNAAHIFGFSSGLALGWLLARPDVQAIPGQRPARLRSILAASALTAAGLAMGYGKLIGFSEPTSAPVKFSRTHEWYVQGEVSNLQAWQSLALRAQAGTVSGAELAQQFDGVIAPFWRMAYTRLKSEAQPQAGPERTFRAALLEFVRLRLAWSQSIAAYYRADDPQALRKLRELADQTDLAQARLDRALFRSAEVADYRTATEPNVVQRLVRLFSAKSNTCLAPPLQMGAVPDSKSSDGPAMRRKAGCEAQEAFLARDFELLTNLLRHSATTMGDLPDGGSRYAGLVAGLRDLSDRSDITLARLASLTSEWRRAVPNAVEPDIWEAILFEEWAWRARGHGSANSVTPQAFALFGHRLRMAEISLNETATRAADNPLWYETSLAVGVGESIGNARMRSIFDRGIAKFPVDFALYRAMLRSLMPRWGGSYEQVGTFIDAELARTRAHLGREMYTRLYWIYSSLEGDDVNLFVDARASWPTMKAGFDDMLRRYPDSDYVLNGLVAFACQAGDESVYADARPRLKARYSAAAWSKRYSMQTCDHNFARRVALERTAEAADSDIRRIDWSSAMLHAEEVIASSPANAAAYLTYSSAAMESGKYDLAENKLRDALKVIPDSAELQHQLGYLYLHVKRPAEALPYLSRSMELAPSDGAAWADRAIAYDFLGRRILAVSDATEACRLRAQLGCDLLKEFGQR